MEHVQLRPLMSTNTDHNLKHKLLSYQVQWKRIKTFLFPSYQAFDFVDNWFWKAKDTFWYSNLLEIPRLWRQRTALISPTAGASWMKAISWEVCPTLILVTEILSCCCSPNFYASILILVHWNVLKEVHKNYLS